MQWMKAGRKPAKKQDPPEEEDNKPWTRLELSVTPGITALAAAVVKQWKLDGCPAESAEAIETWKRLAEGLINEPGIHDKSGQRSVN